MIRLNALLITAVLTLLSAHAQKRLVLVEEFTNTGCGPCAGWSPTLDKVIDDRLGECIAIKYHFNYPNRSDEFYLADKDAQDKRIAFYSINAVPTTLVNGKEFTERNYNALDATITECMNQSAAYGLTVSKELVNHQLSVKTELTPYANVQNTNLRLFVAAIEEHITPATPYPNGETELFYTMRKMLTDGDGEDPGNGAKSLTANQTYKCERQWTVTSFDSEEQLGVVAFLQNIETNEILATAYSGPDAEGENKLEQIRLFDTPDHICVPNYYGKVILRNRGANTLTSATLNVKVNGVVRQYPWTGNMNYLERDTMVFEQFTTFEMNQGGVNTVETWFSDINGNETATSNTISDQFSGSVQATYSVQLKIYTDKKPEETTWKVYNSAGDVVCQGGPYTGQARKFITEDIKLTCDDCYQLEFLDAGGDGIKGANGNGYYQLFQIDKEGKSTRIAQGDYDGAVHDLFFNLTGTPRLVLFEEFTNTSCAPCAEFSPGLDEAVYRRLGDMVSITYHYNFPSAYDPFYLANPNEVMTRANFYQVEGVPALRVDGTPQGAWGHESELDSYIDTAGKVDAKVELSTEASITDGTLNVQVSLTPQGITDGSNLRLFVVAVEERVEWATAAANGERSWNYVMRKMLPDANGQALATELTQVTPYIYNFSWQVANYTDENELGLVTFVQDITTGEILGTLYTPRPTGSTQAAKILKVMDTPNRICMPQFSSKLMVRNTGKETLKSANINVSINGQIQTTPWTGSLVYLAVDSLETPLYNTFTLKEDGANEVEIWLSNLNGGTEESVHKTLSLANAHKATNAVRLTIMTDNAPEEITWKVYNSAGDVLCEGGPYTEARKKQVIDLPLSTDDCYELEFQDAGGNGITGENGRGYYMLHEVDAEGKIRLLVQADYTTATHNVYFGLENAATGILPVTVASQQSQEPYYDMQGRKVAQPTQGIFIQNKQKTIINNK